MISGQRACWIVNSKVLDIVDGQSLRTSTSIHRRQYAARVRLQWLIFVIRCIVSSAHIYGDVDNIVRQLLLPWVSGNVYVERTVGP